MSANINFQGDKASFVSYQTPAWWDTNWSYVTDKQMTALEGLQAANLDYDVVKLPNVHTLMDGSEIISDNSFFTYRTDRNLILGDKLGKQYVVIQNREIFSNVDSLPEHYLETAGALGNGEAVFLVFRYKNQIVVGKDDLVNMYVLVWNSHDGSKAHEVVLTPVRVVCQNTLQAALANVKWKMSIRHTESWEQKSKLALDIVHQVMNGAQKLSEVYNGLHKAKMATDSMVKDYFASVFLTTDEIRKVKEGHPLDVVVSTKKLNILKGVVEYALTGPGQDGFATEPTYWTAYNAVTGYYSNKDWKDGDSRMKSLLDGGSARVMSKALDLAVNRTKIQALGKVNFNNN